MNGCAASDSIDAWVASAVGFFRRYLDRLEKKTDADPDLKNELRSLIEYKPPSDLDRRLKLVSLAGDLLNLKEPTASTVLDAIGELADELSDAQTTISRLEHDVENNYDTGEDVRELYQQAFGFSELQTRLIEESVDPKRTALRELSR